MTKLFTRLLSALIICLSLIMSSLSYAQSPKCGTEQAMEGYYKRYPSAKVRMEAYEKYLQGVKKEVVNELSRKSAVSGPNADTCSQQLYVIPVVFHVFYGESAEKAAGMVLLSQLQSALDIANEDFNMTNKSLINTIDPLFAPIASRLRVKFVMAKKDPQGQPTQGATYHSERRFFGDATQEAEDSVAKYAWDNYKYCNVYVMNYLEHNNNPKPKATFKVSKQETDGGTKKVITGENSQQFLYVGENYFSGGPVTLNVYTPKIDLGAVQNPVLTFSDNLSWDTDYPSSRPEDKSTTILVAQSLTGPWVEVQTLSTPKADFNKWLPRQVDLSPFAGKQIYINFRRNKHHFYYGLDNVCIKPAGTTNCAFKEEFETATAGALPAGWSADVTDYNYDNNNSGIAWYPDKGMNDQKTSRIVFNGWYLGMGGISLNNRSFNSTFSHELGHWLNLKHTFDGNNCSGAGDGVDDTPSTNVAGGGCNATVCGHKINGENFMDYNTSCYKMFTQGQVDRMTLAMQHVARKSIWQLSNLEATGVRDAYDNVCPPQAKFNMDVTKVLAGANTKITFNDQSLHFPTAWEWTIDNGEGAPIKVTTATANAIFNKKGTYDVILKVKNASGENTLTKTVEVIEKTATACKQGEDFNYSAVGTLPASWTKDIPQGNSAVAKVSKDDYVDLDGPMATLKAKDNTTYLFIGENFNSEINGADEINVYTQKYALAGIAEPALYFTDNLAWDKSWPEPRPDDRATTILVAESLAGPWEPVATLSTNKSQMGKWNERKMKLTAFAGKDIYIRIRRNAHHFFYALDDLCINEWDGSVEPGPEPSMGADCKAGEDFNKTPVGDMAAGWKQDVPATLKGGKFRTSSMETVRLVTTMAYLKAADNSNYLYLGENFDDEANNAAEVNLYSGKLVLTGIDKPVIHFVDNLSWDLTWPEERPEDKATTVYVSESQSGPWASVAVLSTLQADIGNWNERKIDLSAYSGKTIYVRLSRNAHHFFYAVDDFCVQSGVAEPDPEPSMGDGCKAGENFNKMAIGKKPGGWTVKIPGGNKATAKITVSENVAIDGAAATIKSADNSQYLFLGENFNDEAGWIDELNLYTSKMSLKGLSKATLHFSDNLAWDASWPEARPEDKATTVFVSTALAGPWDSVTALTTATARFKQWNERTIDLSKYDGQDIYIRFRRNEHHYYYAIEDICIKEAGGSTDPDPEPSMGADCKAGENFDKMKVGSKPAGWKAEIPADNKATVKISTSENVDIDGLKATIKSADNSPYLFLGENFNDALNGPDELFLYSSKMSLKGVKDAVLHFSDNLGWDPSWPAERPDDNATTIFIGESLTGPWDSIAFLSTNQSNFGNWNARSIDLKAYDGKDIYIRIRRNEHHFYYALEDVCIKGTGGSVEPEPTDCKTGENFDKTAAGSIPAGWTENIPAGMTVSYKVTPGENVDIDGDKATIKGKDQSPYLFIGENYNAAIEAPDEINLYTPKISLKDLKEVKLNFIDNLAWDAYWPKDRPDDEATTVFVSESLTGTWDSVTVLTTNKSNFKNWNERSISLSKYEGKEIYIRLRRNEHHYYYAIDGLCIKGTSGGTPNPTDTTGQVQPPLGKGPAFALMITPNPVTKVLRVTFLNRTPGTVNFQIIDMGGRVVMHGKLQSAGGASETHDWPVSSLAPGVYLLKLQNSQTWESQRFIKL